MRKSDFAECSRQFGSVVHLFSGGYEMKRLISERPDPKLRRESGFTLIEAACVVSQLNEPNRPW